MIYGVYLAYSAIEVYGYREEGMKEYPRDIARVRICKDKRAQLDCYANTMCPASQLIEAETKEEFDKEIEQLKNNFENEEWLEANIHPYL